MNETGPVSEGKDSPLAIGEWILDPALNRLERGDELLHLEPKAVAVLLLLARKHGESVSRQELLDRAWQGTVVSDDALTQVIIKLRKAFGDNSRNPAYIQTIPKRGYRLVAPVHLMQKENRNRPRKSLVQIFCIWLPFVIAILAVVTLVQFQLSNDGPGDQQTQEQAPAPVPMSIAVMPFESPGSGAGTRLSGFARGIAADLATDLSRLPALRVMSASILQAGHPSARYLVSGTVQQSEDRLLLHVSLTDSRTGQQLWSDRMERETHKLFEMQQALSSEIVDRLAIRISRTEKQRLAKRYTRNLGAYEDFQRGQAQLLLREREANLRAREWYREAIAKDPAFARAYAGMALSFAADYRNQWVEDGDRALRQAVEMSSTAQQIDPHIPEVYWVLAYVDMQYRKHEQAMHAVERAIELDRSYADAYALQGGINTYRGEVGKTVPLLREAMRLRPDAGYLYFLLLGRAYFFLGDNEQALINLNEALMRNPESLEAHLYLAATDASMGDPDEADWQLQEIRLLDPGFRLSRWLETYPMTDSQQVGQLLALLEPLGF